MRRQHPPDLIRHPDLVERLHAVQHVNAVVEQERQAGRLIERIHQPLHLWPGHLAHMVGRPHQPAEDQPRRQLICPIAVLLQVFVALQRPQHAEQRRLWQPHLRADLLQRQWCLAIKAVQNIQCPPNRAQVINLIARCSVAVLECPLRDPPPHSLLCCRIRRHHDPVFRRSCAVRVLPVGRYCKISRIFQIWYIIFNCRSRSAKTRPERTRMHRRDVLKLGGATAVAAALNTPLLSAQPHVAPAESGETEQWGLFEISLKGPSTGNPFRDVTLSAQFTHEHRIVEAKGFYDGDGSFRIRFMPDTPGAWTYKTTSSAAELNGHTGRFTCTPPKPGNHGPVTTAHQFHFEHADGTPYFPFGTTTYAFFFTSDENAANSLAGMTANFNKTRACVLPKPLGSGPLH